MNKLKYCLWFIYTNACIDIKHLFFSQLLHEFSKHTSISTNAIIERRYFKYLFGYLFLIKLRYGIVSK